MSEVELEVEETNEELEDTTTDAPDEISYEQALAWKQKAERAEKAEKKLVELKKQLKEKEAIKKDSWLSEDELDLREEVSDFIRENPEFKEYRNDMLKYRKQGFTIKQAKALIENDDKTIENRKKLEQTKITSWEFSWDKSVYTKDEIAKMSQAEYNKFRDLKDQWKVSVKG